MIEQWTLDENRLHTYKYHPISATPEGTVRYLSSMPEYCETNTLNCPSQETTSLLQGGGFRYDLSANYMLKLLVRFFVFSTKRYKNFFKIIAIKDQS